jgi:hypothetical protein
LSTGLFACPFTRLFTCAFTFFAWAFAFPDRPVA